MSVAPQRSAGRKVGVLILNLLFPGVGTLVLGGQARSGVIQLVVWIIGSVLRVLHGPLVLIGDLLVVAMFVWALFVSIRAFTVK